MTSSVKNSCSAGTLNSREEKTSVSLTSSVSGAQAAAKTAPISKIVITAAKTFPFFTFSSISECGLIELLLHPATVDNPSSFLGCGDEIFTTRLTNHQIGFQHYLLMFQRIAFDKIDEHLAHHSTDLIDRLVDRR